MLFFEVNIAELPYILSRFFLMPWLFLEIVPRTEDKFLEELHSVSEMLPKISWINIPYTKWCQLHSIEAIDQAQRLQVPWLLVPHIRARDLVRIEWQHIVSHTDTTLELIEALVKRWVEKILVVQGDPHEWEWDDPEISPAFIKYLKDTTKLKVFWAIDQYRWKGESERIERKKWAGVDGFFTQPFFDAHSVETSRNQWHNMEVYYGFAPVTTEKSKSYWEKVNNVVFPSDFSLCEEANIELARKNIEFLRISGQWAYLMPIRFNAKRYLSGVLAQKI